ncbi:MAG TPA: cupin domain-containing protein [Chthonomonadales bacterium]|nr:cupin domain-containing protein [Chthonomonadales bacterium]
MHIINRHCVQPFITKDGSTIREILAPRNSCIVRQSLAEATLPPGARTEAHYHPNTEEIYYILSGAGRIRMGEEERTVGPGDGIAIPPGEPHQMENTGSTALVFLCCCVPAYEHEDTVMVPSLFPDASASS